jgi:hypothetical protein
VLAIKKEINKLAKGQRFDSRSVTNPGQQGTQCGNTRFEVANDLIESDENTFTDSEEEKNQVGHELWQRLLGPHRQRRTNLDSGRSGGCKASLESIL